MYSISICDADKRSRDYLEQILNCYLKAKEPLTGTRKFESFSDMLRSGITTDILFLDEQLLKIEGVKRVRMLLDSNPDMHLFVLGDGELHSDYMTDLYAFRYLKKPVNPYILYSFLNAVFQEQKTVSFTSRYLPVTLKENEIVCVYSLARKTYVMTDKGITYPTISSMKQWKEKVGASKNFIHPHYSYIINLKYMESFDGRTIVLKSLNGKVMRVIPSQRRLVEFRNNYYGKNRNFAYKL